MILKGIAVFSLICTLALTAVLNVFCGWSLLLAPVWFAGCYLVGLLLVFLFMMTVLHPVDITVPQEEDSPFYRRVMTLLIELLAVLCRIRITANGMEKLPRDGRFLLVCNHQNDIDPAALLLVFRKSQLAFISKKENADMFAVGKFMHKTLCQMIDRENDREALKTILKCIRLIQEDKVSVAVFPEGGIKEKYKLNPFRCGVFKIAQKANVPIVVCTISGTTPALHNIKRLRPTDVRVNLVGVIPAEELKGKNTVEIGERVHAMMQEDLGESWKLET